MRKKIMKNFFILTETWSIYIGQACAVVVYNVSFISNSFDSSVFDSTKKKYDQSVGPQKLNKLMEKIVF